MNILIVEDDFIIAEQLRGIIEEHGDTVLGHADTVADAVALLTPGIDLCFVDIYLRDRENGIELAKILHERGTSFLFLTANNEMEMLKKAVNTQPISYITKPFSERDIIASLEMARMRLSKSLELKTHQGTITIRQSEIMYVEADNVYVTVVTTGKTYVQRMTLKEMEAKLDENFQRVHRSFLVNKNKITSRTAQYVLVGETRIPVSKKDS